MLNITLQTQLNLIIIIIIVSLNNYFVKSQNSVNPIYENCNETTQNIACGSETIKYPFYINGQQQSYCGHRNFQLSCDNSAAGPPSLNISGDSYTIHGIGYQNRTILVANAALTLSGNKYGPCIPPLTNLSLPAGGAISLRQNQRRVFLLYGCQNTNRFSGGGTQSRCQYNTHSVLALSDDFESRMAEISETCGGVTAVEAPSSDYGNSTDGVSDLKTALTAGFVLDWAAALSVSCGDCNRSGGICGSNDTSAFECYCPDGPTSDGVCSEDTFSPAPSPRLLPFHRDIVAPVPSLPPFRHGAPITLVVKTGVPIVTLVAVSIISAILLYFLRKKKREQTKKHVLAKLKELKCLVILYSYSEIKTMTNGFKEELGSGGFGVVYKGERKDEKDDVAVKVLKHRKTNYVLGKTKPPDIDQGVDSFVEELAAISSASHVNVLKLLGFCYEPGLWLEGTKRAFVFEFMEKGSLYNYLPCNRQELGFEKGYQICIGIADGLQYLHKYCHTRIVHFDIKPDNILLDGKFVPKISDFGLAKTCPEGTTQVQITDRKGTPGYMAPERSNGESIGSRESDVYSYGMIVFAILNLTYNPDISNNTANTHCPKDRLKFLQEISNNDRDDKIKKEIIMIKLGLKCVEAERSARPTMTQVKNRLEMIVDLSDIAPIDHSCPPISAMKELSPTKYLTC